MGEKKEEQIEYMVDREEYTEWLIKSEENRKLNKHRYILKNYQPPGDILMLTACVRDIKKWYPFMELDVNTSTPDVWKHNPYLSSLDEDDPDVFCMDMDYEIIHQSNENMNNHFIHGFIDDFNKKAGYAVKLTEFKPDVYLTDSEKESPVFDDQPEHFVVINAGGKTDYKSKWWWEEAWTKVVTNCPDIQFIQVGKTDEDSHVHSKIETANCIDKLGKTSTRELLRLIYQSVGTVSVVTALMHMAAAFDRHAAIIAGGHEPWWWEKYPNHDYFHTIGRLNCCRFGGCWQGECEHPDKDGRQRCLKLIKPKDVARAIQKWFD